MPEGEFKIRRFEMTDVDRVWTIHKEALRKSGLEFREDAADEDFTQIPDRYLAVGGEFLVGLVEEEPVAMGGFCPESDGCVQIRRMRVHPDFQGRGYGKRMLRELESRAIDRGYRTFQLYTNSKLVTARELYSQEGYEIRRRDTHEPSGETFIYYEKEIGQGADSEH